jgi:hypothetical protein
MSPPTGPPLFLPGMPLMRAPQPTFAATAAPGPVFALVVPAVYTVGPPLPGDGLHGRETGVGTIAVPPPKALPANGHDLVADTTGFAVVLVFVLVVGHIVAARVLAAPEFLEDLRGPFGTRLGTRPPDSA